MSQTLEAGGVAGLSLQGAVTGSDLCLSAAGPNHFPGAWTRFPDQMDPEATLCMKPNYELVPLPTHDGKTGSKVRPVKQNHTPSFLPKMGHLVCSTDKQHCWLALH